MKLAKRIGMKKAKGEGRHRPEDRRDSPLYLGRRYVIRLGPREAGLTLSREFLVRSAGLAMSRSDGGCGGGLSALSCTR
jgi:transposase